MFYFCPCKSNILIIMNLDIHTLSDSLLWKRFLEGDSSAYTQIYNRTVQDLFRFGLLYTSDKELIKDCIHDVFVKIHMNRAKLAPTDNIAAYLTVALKNTLFNALKKTTDSLSFDEIGEREETVDESPSTPETIYINNEQEKQVQATVHTMMSVLTDRQREIIYYRYIKEMSIDEISKVTDMNNQSISNSIQRALGRIRDLFKRK
ncbi:sigma-70, region 4 [Bacteroides ovatus SD CMC 3f]|nr:sigma-70, region 4 [Bacteroides ovatus SD CMC 3f]